MKDYQQLAERTSATATLDGQCQCISRFNGKLIRILHGSMGLNSEAGEFEGAVKAHIFYGKPLDLPNLEEELGDILWYCAEIANGLGTTIEAVMEKNIAKLRTRYPGKFNSHDAINRDLDAEKEALGQ